MMPEEPPTSSLKELDSKLKVARGQFHAKDPKNVESKAEAGNGLGIALKIGVEFVSAVGVGVAIGLFFDYWLETKPWLMLVFFILGSAAGFLNIFRVMGGFGYAAGYDAKNAEKKSDRPESE